MFLKRPYSLKNRLMQNLLISSLIPLLLIGCLSYFTIYSLLNVNIESGIKSNLRQIRSSFSNTLFNLNRSSMLLAIDNGRIANNMERYIHSADLIEKYENQKQITEYLGIVNTAGNNLGLIFIYDADKKEVMFQNMEPASDINMEAYPILFQGGLNVSYHGPHRSAKYKSDYTVLSISRKISLIDSSNLYVYIETDSKLFNSLVHDQQYNLKTSHIIVNDSGEVVYSQLPEQLHQGSRIDISGLEADWNPDKLIQDYYTFVERFEEGWYLIAAIRRMDYNYEVYKWAVGFTMLALLCIMGSLLLARSIWRTVYRPLRSLNSEIGLISQNQFDSEIRHTGINEFDHMLDRFQHMRRKIVELLREVEVKESKKRIAEVEKLMYQINPHFIHNTLNTIQWIARMNGQDEIDRLVALFTRVLHYNLGKEGGTVHLGEEAIALQDYVDLQRIRYDYKFNVEINISDDLADIRIPRFILQPIVENSLYHGMRDEDGYIRVNADKAEDALVVRIEDNGKGMTEEEVQNLLANRTDVDAKVGMGIGLSYVKNILEYYYGKKGVLDIKSILDSGTVFELRLPLVLQKAANTPEATLEANK